MKTLLLALALLACCTAHVPSEFRNLTTTEIEYNSHVQSLIPSALNDVLAINDIENKFNTTDFIVDKINFVSQKEFSNGYIYKINVDFLNSADEVAKTEFIGTYNNKMKQFSVRSLNYDIKYPKVEQEQEIFVPSPINGTHSTGIYRDLRNYINENFNSTVTYTKINGKVVMHNNTDPIEYFNSTQQWGNYSTPSYNVSNNTNSNWVNNTNSMMNNRTNMTNNEISTANMTEFVYNTLNTLVDRFNSTMNFDNKNSFNKTFEDFPSFDELDFEPVLDNFLEFAKKGIEETFGMNLNELVTGLLKLNLGENYEALHEMADGLHDVADELGNIFA